jgi:phosphatidylethanolamine/phosphatidyl-N-methylethanolamine N-methyltransferase
MVHYPNYLGEDSEWIDYPEKCAQHYEQLNYTGPPGYFMSMSHSIAEKTFGVGSHFDTVLEVGAGSGQHIKYVKHSFREYIITDVNEELVKSTAKRFALLHPGKVKYRMEDCANLAIEDESVDRLIATHVLEHIYYPHKVLKEWYRVLKRGGVLTIVLPCDPGIIWRIARMAARRKAVRLGYSYDYLMARDHVNPINNLVALLHYYFPKRKEIWFPFGFPSMDLNFYYACHIPKTCNP